MKNITRLSVSGLLLLSATSLAQTEGGVKNSGDQFYLGADLTFANNVNVSEGGDSADQTSDVGFNFAAGYEFNTHTLVKTGVEAEYRFFGDADFSDVSNVDGDAFFINLKPKLFVLYDFGNLYFAPMVGVGHISIDGKTNNQRFSENKAGYQAGVEFGTRLKQNIDFHLGYRATFVSLDDTDFNLSGAYAGARYFF